MASNLYLLLLAGALALVAIAASLVVVLVVARRALQDRAGIGDVATRPLREPYARGEITPEEFQRIRDDLADSQ
ncbi:MAG: SHOCT domain-containing protein [Anaerolineae bacterium]